MGSFSYEHSTSYRGHLIVPWIFSTVNNRTLYSYTLLSEFGHQGQFHQAENPAELYAFQPDRLIEAAKAHLDCHADPFAIPDFARPDYFKCRYIYRGNLIIVHGATDKYFYDHYPPQGLKNIAAPKLFRSEAACLQWVKEGLDRNAGTQAPGDPASEGNKSSGK